MTLNPKEEAREMERMLELKTNDWLEACLEIEKLEAKLEVAKEALKQLFATCLACNAKGPEMDDAKEALTKLGEK